jgi:hypothetical protein
MIRLVQFLMVMGLVSIMTEENGAQPFGSAVPYELSVVVQTRARELKVFELAAKDYGFVQNDFPLLAVSDPRPLQALQGYLDQLAAADVMAAARARRQNRQATTGDYDIMFASWCVFVPNKPVTDTIREVTGNVRRRALIGMYLSRSKRELLVEKAMRRVLSEGTTADLFKSLGAIRSPEDYNREILDTAILMNR